MRCRQVSFLSKKPSSLPPRRAMLLVGPSGSGKTHLAKTAAWAARIPFYVMDAEIMNRDGYSGATFYSEIEHAQKLFGSNVLDADKPFMVLVENIDIAARSANSTSNDPLCDFVDLLKGCYRYTCNDDFILVFLDDLTARSMRVLQVGMFSANRQSMPLLFRAAMRKRRQKASRLMTLCHGGCVPISQNA